MWEVGNSIEANTFSLCVRHYIQNYLATNWICYRTSRLDQIKVYLLVPMWVLLHLHYQSAKTVVFVSRKISLWIEYKLKINKSINYKICSRQIEYTRRQHSLNTFWILVTKSTKTVHFDLLTTNESLDFPSGEWRIIQFRTPLCKQKAKYYISTPVGNNLCVNC